MLSELLPAEIFALLFVFVRVGAAFMFMPAFSEPFVLMRARLILALAPCPTGWGYDPRLSAEIGRLAVKTGMWPLKEYVDGRVVHTRKPRDRRPVEDYLQLQGRFRHLFEPTRNDEVIAEIQSRVDAYWAEVERAC